jgi:hypothetical protein
VSDSAKKSVANNSPAIEKPPTRRIRFSPSQLKFHPAA